MASEEFKTEEGVRQGGVFPIFTIVMDDIIK